MCGRSAGAEALRVNPSPRRSLRSGARVSEGPELAGSRSAKVGGPIWRRDDGNRTDYYWRREVRTS